MKFDGPVKRSRGLRNPGELIEARCRRLYRRQMDGLTSRQLVYEHAAREGISIATAWRDWSQVHQWNEEDWEKDRINMLSRIQAMRVRLINAALKKGQLQTAAQVLDSLGRALGEHTPEQVSISAPTLNIQVEAKKEPEKLPESQVIDAEITQEPEKIEEPNL